MRDHKGKVEEVRDKGFENLVLLDKKLDVIGEILIRKRGEVMEHAEDQLTGIRLTEEEQGKIVDKMADQLLEKCMNLPGKKKTKETSKTKEDNDLSDDEFFPKQAPAESKGDAGGDEPTQDPHTDEAREEDTEPRHLEEEESTAEQQHNSMEIEDNDEEEDDGDDKWAKQKTIEDTSMVVIDRNTSSDTSMESPTSTTLTSET